LTPQAGWGRPAKIPRCDGHFAGKLRQKRGVKNDKNRKKVPFFPLNKAKKGHVIGGLVVPQKGSFGPQNRRFWSFLANFGHFAGKLRQKQAPQKGQKRSILTPF